MNPSNFDDLTKALANSSSRRHALRVIVTTAVGGLLGLTSVSTAFGRHQHRTKKTSKPSGSPPSNSKCAKFCAAVFGPNTPAANTCTSDAAHNKMGNLCQKCNGNASSICCTTTGGYCGTGATCCSTSMGERCCSGVCVQADCCDDGDCGNGQKCCSGTCADCCTDSDCGGNGATCQGGTCVQTCVSAGGTCTMTSQCCSGLTCDAFTCRVCTSVGGMCTMDNDCCGNMDCPSGNCCVRSNIPGPNDQICTATTQCCDAGAGAICEDPPHVGVVPRCCFPQGASVPGGCSGSTPFSDPRCCFLSCEEGACL
jgi:hypothetical protein